MAQMTADQQHYAADLIGEYRHGGAEGLILKLGLDARARLAAILTQEIKALREGQRRGQSSSSVLARAQKLLGQIGQIASDVSKLTQALSDFQAGVSQFSDDLPGQLGTLALDDLQKAVGGEDVTSGLLGQLQSLVTSAGAYQTATSAYQTGLEIKKTAELVWNGVLDLESLFDASAFQQELLDLAEDALLKLVAAQASAPDLQAFIHEQLRPDELYSRRTT